MIDDKHLLLESYKYPYLYIQVVKQKTEKEEKANKLMLPTPSVIFY